MMAPRMGTRIRPSTGPFLALCCLLVMACSYEWHAMRRIPVEGYGVPAPDMDLIASEVRLESKGGVKFREGEARMLREHLGRAMEQVLRPHHPEDKEPTRFRVVATLERKGNWSYAYIVLPFAPFIGMPLHRVDANVSLELQIGDKVYKGEGRKRVFAGFYYNHNTRERATAAAFRAALAQAVANAGQDAPEG